MQTLLTPESIRICSFTSPFKISPTGTAAKSLTTQEFSAQPPSSVKFPLHNKSHGLSIRGGSLKAVVKIPNNMDTRPIVVIDNYDSFTYNLCQVSAFFF